VQSHGYCRSWDDLCNSRFWMGWVINPYIHRCDLAHGTWADLEIGESCTHGSFFRMN